MIIILHIWTCNDIKMDRLGSSCQSYVIMSYNFIYCKFINIIISNLSIKGF